ncbi:MAG: hypothetical protein LBV26_09255 [Bacteroidales bacterium]|jgi:hypothetical protein|nr:hypothetical protein [Bacteroidales bacterium]
MDINPLLNLFNKVEKSMLKSYLLSFPIYYFVLFFFFTSFQSLIIIDKIMITAGTTISVTTILFMTFAYAVDETDIDPTTFVITGICAATVVASLMKHFWGRGISTWFILMVLWCVGCLVGIRRRTSKKQKHTDSEQQNSKII